MSEQKKIPVRCIGCGATNKLSIHRVKVKPTLWIPEGGLYDPTVHRKAEAITLDDDGRCAFCRRGTRLQSIADTDSGKKETPHGVQSAGVVTIQQGDER